MDWNEFLKTTNKQMGTMQKEMPKTFEGFGVMSVEAKKDGALSEKTKEFMALGIAIATRCDSCIGFHVKSLVRLKATREEFCEALAMASYMGGGPSLTYSAKALEAFDQFSS